MEEKNFTDMEDLMLEYGEMTSFNFDSADYQQVREMQRLTGSEYADKPYPFKYGNFDLVDMIHSFITQYQKKETT